MLLSAKEIINKSLELFKRDIRIWFPYMVVSFILALLGVIVVFNPIILLFFATLGVSPIVVLFLNMIVLLILALGNIWFQLALVRTIHKRLFNQSALPLKQQFGETRHLLAKAVGISLLVGILVFLPLGLSIAGLSITGFQNLILGNLKGVGLVYLFFGLLGIYGIIHCIYFSVRYALSYYVVAIDEKTIRESLHEGNKLTHSRMGEIFWRLAVPVIAFLLVYILINYIFTALAKFIGHSVAVSAANIVLLAVSAVVALLSVIATVILYEDAKAKPVTVMPKVKKA